MQLVEQTKTLPALMTFGLGFNATVGPVATVSDAKAAVQYCVNLQSPTPLGGQGVAFRFRNVTVWCGRTYTTAEPARAEAQARWKQDGPLAPAPAGGAVPGGVVEFGGIGEGPRTAGAADLQGGNGVGTAQVMGAPAGAAGGSGGVGDPPPALIAILAIVGSLGAFARAYFAADTPTRMNAAAALPHTVAGGMRTIYIPAVCRRTLRCIAIVQAPAWLCCSGAAHAAVHLAEHWGG